MPQRFAAFIYTFLLFTFNYSLYAQNTYSNQFSPEINVTSKPFNNSTIGFDLYSNRESDADTATSFGYQSTIGGKFWFNHYFK